MLVLRFCIAFLTLIKPARSAEKVPLRAQPGRSIPCTNPATGEVFGQDLAFSKEQVDECIERASQAQKEWHQTSWAERRRVLSDLLAFIVSHQKDICEQSIRDSGKTWFESYMGEVMMSCEKIRWIIEQGEQSLGPEPRHVPALLFLKKAQVEYYPLGVIGIIIPWNYPIHNAISAAVAAIFAGNGAIIKVSEFSCGSRPFIESMFRQVLANRGHNPELVQVIGGYGDTGAALVKGKIDLAFFIGSPQTGKKVMAAAVDNLTPVILELGGKDADLDHCVSIAARAAFYNCGQNCISAERFYIQESIYDKFVEKVTKLVSQMRQGSTCDCGSMTMPGQVDIVEAAVKDAVEKGAKVVLGGKRNAALGGLHYEPTVLINVNHTMRVANEESFGPIMPIIKFKTEEEVITMANSTVYALNAAIFSVDRNRANRVASKIVSGMSNVNDWAVNPLIQSLPFGGVKYSGFGRFNGPEGLRGFSRQKSVVTDRFPVLTQTPKFMSYPIPPITLVIIPEVISLLYAGTWALKGAALGRLLKGVLFGDTKKKEQ